MRSARVSAFGLLACGAALGACADSAPEEHVASVAEAVTVDATVTMGCSTKAVEGLSKQIVAQASCISPGAFAAVPARPNLMLGSAVFAYLEPPAKDALLATLDANTMTPMTVNSMLRTVAQQYLLYRWYQTGQCSIALAAKPGTSNHETGLALDVQNYTAWQTALEGHGFKWLGPSDVVHFDYVGAGAKDQTDLEVRAFQQLWNQNNPADPIAEDGAYGPQTEARLKASPAEGFPKGATCGTGGGGAGGMGGAGGAAPASDLVVSAKISDASDTLGDGPSAKVPDLFEGKRYTLAITVKNQAASAANSVPLVVTPPYALSGDPAALGQILASIPAGKSASVNIALSAVGYSIHDVPPAQIEIGAGKAKANVPVDVYSDRRFDFDGERREGWTSAQTIAATKDGVLELEGPAGALAAESRALDVTTAGLGDVLLAARRAGGSGKARLYLDESGYDLALPADGQLHALVIPASALPAHVAKIRFVPFEGGAMSQGTAALDYLHLGVMRGIRGENGCGCETGVSRGTAPFASVALWLLAVVLRRRRK
jgi:uncharacterized protein (TIGR03382 family)